VRWKSEHRANVRFGQNFDHLFDSKCQLIKLNKFGPAFCTSITTYMQPHAIGHETQTNKNNTKCHQETNKGKV
jgi:hypothetical protein